MRMPWPALLFCFLALPAQAAELLNVLVEQRGTVYRVELDARFAAPAGRLRTLLTDYPHLDRINPSIHTSEVLAGAGPGRDRVRTVAKVCVAIFCKEIEQVQDLEVAPDGSINATVRPKQSDFRYGFARWRFEEDAAGTRMRFVSEIEPAFWVPPLIGPWLIQRALRAEALESIHNLERLAGKP
ncbi:SRPBCC family protein [Thiohalobacter sp.]|uniref:SRPBCC family protein n=1 Tax=Thiohalobacter sp. TaxID=2025948 RepID=UPI0026335491|nr:SRPBCC family protein [Thiohalobacter sp.]